MADPLFNYSDDEWATIAAELPKSIEHKWSRDEIERLSGLYILSERMGAGMRTPTALREQTAWGRVSKSAQDLAAAVEELGNAMGGCIDPLTMLWPREQERDKAVAALEAIALLPKIAEAAQARGQALAEGSKERRRRSNAAPPWWSESYLKRLLRHWEQAGGALRTSTDPGTGSATGPLVRFLEAATGPAFAASGKPPPTGEALRAFVRKARRIGNAHVLSGAT